KRHGYAGCCPVAVAPLRACAHAERGEDGRASFEVLRCAAIHDRGDDAAAVSANLCLLVAERCREVDVWHGDPRGVVYEVAAWVSIARELRAPRRVAIREIRVVTFPTHRDVSEDPTVESAIAATRAVCTGGAW